ncbi:MAG: response regulator [Desulfobacteraceae bacterium]|nr:response regulator [Desulfobacteraceae bacterium]MBC2719619.1 response regulator [Desulfobacteraceae bacterium]
MRFRTKQMLVFSLLMALICSAFLIFSLAFYKNSMVEKAEYRRASLTIHLHNDIIDMVYTGDVLQLTAAIKSIRSDVTYIDYIFVIGDNGHLLAHTFDTGFPSELFNVNFLPAGKLATSKLLITDKGRVKDFAIRTARHMPGEIHVGMNEEVFYKQINDSVKMTIIMTIVCLAIGLFLVYVVSGYLSKPLKNLSLGMEKIENGDLKYRLEEKGDYEILNLLRGYNRMTESMLVSTTRLQQAKEALIESEAKFRTLVEKIPTITYTAALDEYGTTQYISPQIESILGFTQEEFKANNDIWDKQLHLDDRNRVLKETAASHPNDIPFVSEYRMLKKTGRTVWFRDEAVVVKNEAGEPIFVQGMMIDITESKQAEKEKKKLEAQLRQSQKMEAVGTLAGGVAHDFNNLMTVIIGNAQLALMNVIKDESIREGIEEIKKAGEKATSLTRQLLAFSRKQIIKPEIMDLNIGINETEKMLKRMIGEDIEFQTVLEPELWKVYADSGQIDQIIINMVVNARDAMPQGGLLTIETANADLDKNYFRERGIHEEKPGHYVMLAVSDTGIGMDKETREHVFDPFFTTKEVGKGTGLGLSTAYGIVKQNNGFIWVYSEPGKGTTFKVYLSKVEGDVEAEEKERTCAEHPGGSETVLIVEDDDSLRNFAQKALRQLGYKLLVAENGEDALKVCKEHDGQIDLMITDVVMPKMGGREAVERLQPLYPRMKVIYMSGYTDNAIVRHGVLAPGLNFLEKPFTPKKLACKVRETLDN